MIRQNRATGMIKRVPIDTFTEPFIRMFNKRERCVNMIEQSDTLKRDTLKTDLFTTTPQSIAVPGSTFPREVRKIARESEANGYKGTLIYSDNRLVDPWTVATVLIEETENLLPMIALQPVYMHPYTVAKKISSIALLYNRQLSLNLIAGGFKNDLLALGDNTEHDRRYDRLIEYTQIIQGLLKGERVTLDGDFYSVKNLKLEPELPDDLQPLYYLSGSSDAARRAAGLLSASLIEYPEPKEAYRRQHMGNGTLPTGIRIGVLARDSHEEAWEEAMSRFPKTREGALTHQLAKKTSDSNWHKKLSEQGEQMNGEKETYWLGPFKHYHTFCPYLVGNYEEVSVELTHYLQAGCSTCILDIPVSEAELIHTKLVFKKAEERVTV